MRLSTWRKDNITRLKNIRTLINENPMNVKAYRRGTTGDGFSTEIGDETKIDIRLIKIAPANNSYREIAMDLNQAMEDTFIAIAIDKDIEKGDTWEIENSKYIVKMIGTFDLIYKGLTEVILEKFSG
jgi:hypothetical protein